jgi:SAM-dependent methyltransferase
MGYAFGTGDVAAERLLLLADVFAPSMAAVLGALPRRDPPLVVDLGCGPGSSTAHLGRLLRAGRIVGLDSSPSFVALARERVPGASFVVADVTGDWPVPPADLIYARFLLSHLPDPLDLLRTWAGRLRPGGYLVVEEPAHIATTVPAFRRYLELTAGLIASRGAALYVGRDLATVAGARLNRDFRLDVSARDAAAMFTLNLRSWRDDPWIRAATRPSELDGLVAAFRETTTPVRWTLRQLVIERRSS